LTDARPIEPTSTRCLSARRPNPAEAPLIDAEILFRQPQPPHSEFRDDPNDNYMVALFANHCWKLFDAYNHGIEQTRPR